MEGSKLILCVGDEGSLSETRARVIETTGASVIMATSCSEAFVSAQRHRLAAVIVGHGFDPSEQKWIEDAVHSVHGAIPVLRLPAGVVSPEMLVKFVSGVPNRV